MCGGRGKFGTGGAKDGEGILEVEGLTKDGGGMKEGIDGGAYEACKGDGCLWSGSGLNGG